MINLEKKEEIQKLVYAFSHLYNDIPSIEEQVCEPINDLIIKDHLGEISVHLTDFHFLDVLFFIDYE